MPFRYSKTMRRSVLLGSLISLLVLADAHDLLGQRAAAAKPAAGSSKAVWVRIPITGLIGEDFTADDMRGGIRRAKSARADVIVLELDTPGGRLDHAEQIIDIIIRARGIRFVAVVNRAEASEPAWGSVRQKLAQPSFPRTNGCNQRSFWADVPCSLKMKEVMLQAPSTLARAMSASATASTISA